MQASLPQLLFRRCHLNCVDSEQFSAESPAEQACIRNCQDKVYASFELYMGVNQRKDQVAAMHIDKSAYTGMEVEHSNDTSGRVYAPNHKTMNITTINNFSRNQQREHRGLRN